MNCIRIDKYDTRIVNGQIRYYAIKGKEEYEMPDAYKEMYDNNHLAIMKRTIERPQVFNLSDEEHYIPLNTVITSCPKKPKKTQ